MNSKSLLPVLAVLAGSTPALFAQTISGCAVFPANNVWNTPIDQLPVDASSAAYVSTIGASKGLHPDFSSGGAGIPFVVVSGTQPKVPISFTYADESDPGPYPIPPDAPIEGGSTSTGDRHVLVLDNGNCVLYEVYNAWPRSDGSWTGDSGAVFDLKSNLLRPAGWTSADAAGLPILPGLVRYDEVASGEIRHAIRMTVPQTRNMYIWPARHLASSLTGAQYPPMGQRFRLKASFDITPYPADAQVILKALKTYGAFVADNGSSWYLTGVPDSRWNDTTLHSLGQVLGSNLEAVDETSLITDVNSGATSTSLTLTGVTLNPAQLAGGAVSTQNQVTLSGSAPAGGVTVTLSSSNPAAASVPASVFVPSGVSSATFQVTTSTVTAATAVTISASWMGVVKTATLTVSPAAALSSISISPTTVTGGTGATGSVKLNSPAPAGGAVVRITSSDSHTASAPSTVTVPAGQTSAAFSISTKRVTAVKTVTFTATYAGSSQSAALTVNPRP